MARPHPLFHVDFTREVLTREGELWFRIEGRSMRPFLRTGDRVLIRSCSIDSLTCGDLVLLNVGDSLCLHRVLMNADRDGPRRLRSKGDACGRWDLPVTGESIVGKGVAVNRGTLTMSLDNWAGRLLGYLSVCVSLVTGWGLWLKWRLQA